MASKLVILSEDEALVLADSQRLTYAEHIDLAYRDAMRIYGVTLEQITTQIKRSGPKDNPLYRAKRYVVTYLLKRLAWLDHSRIADLTAVSPSFISAIITRDVQESRNHAAKIY